MLRRLLALLPPQIENFILNNWLNLIILTIIAAFAYVSGWQSALKNGGTDPAWWSSFLQNFSTEMIGAFVTFLLFERILGSQKEKREKAEQATKEQQQKAEQIEELKKRLVREAGGQSNETAKAAVDRLRDEGWLTIKDSVALLKEANLKNTKLQGANLWGANLQEAQLPEANLQRVNLWRANLQQAVLFHANLRGSKDIESAIFDEKTVLPDAELIDDGKGNYIYDKYWTPETKMRRYTDPNHKDEDGNPDFWEPDYLKPGCEEWKKPW